MEEEDEVINQQRQAIARGPIELGLERDDVYSKTSFGKLVLSTEKSSPVFGFGTGHRDAVNNLFINEDLAKNISMGKFAPGPN
jgi:hypothetical protein